MIDTAQSKARKLSSQVFDFILEILDKEETHDDSIDLDVALKMQHYFEELTGDL